MARDWTNLRRASFRGVSFHVMQENPAVGRRIAVHEISGGEAIITEDMGRRTGLIDVDAYITGNIADVVGRALERACALPGASLLTMPIDGARLVHCEDCRRERHKDRNGMIVYQLRFVEAGNEGFGFASALSQLKLAFDNGLSAISIGLSR